MARGTKKVGITGKFGPRYGVTIRKRIIEASKARQKSQRCPECKHHAVKRVSSGIWKCRHCKLVFAAGAYSIRMRNFKKDESISVEDKAYREEYIEPAEEEVQEPDLEQLAKVDDEVEKDLVEETTPEEPSDEPDEEPIAEDEPLIENEPDVDETPAADDDEPSTEDDKPAEEPSAREDKLAEEPSSGDDKPDEEVE